MLKWLHRGLVGLLLVVAVATVAAIAISSLDLVFVDQEVKTAEGVGCVLIGVENRRLSLSWILRRPPPKARSMQFSFDHVGISIMRFAWGPAFITYALIPLWMIVALAMPYPGFLLYRTYRRRRGSPANVCPHCSYDLTGNESGVCSECGEVLASRDPDTGAVST